MSEKNDKENLLFLLERFGVEPRMGQDCGDGDDCVTLEAGEGGVDGYPYFVCIFRFDAQGQFKGVGVFE